MLTVLDKNTEVVLAYLEKAKNVCVSEKINGEYILTFWLPRSDPKWQYIETENYVRCEGQLFIIRTTEEERDAAGRLTANVQCEHVYTELIDEYQDQLLNFAGTSAEFALTQILQGTRFTIGTVDDFGLNDLFDLGETNKLDCTEQVKDTWGGEFKWDNRECNLLTERGADNGVQFRYAKNLKSIKRTVDSKNLITRLYGYGRDGLTIEGLDTSAWTQDEKDRLLVGVTVDGSGIITSKYIDSQYINNYPIPKCGKKEFNDISDQKTLLEKMQDYMAANEVPKVTYEVDFIELKKLGYKFEDVALGDTVTAIDEPLQANIKARIYEYEYYPYEAERSKVRLANFRENITDLLGEFQDSKDLVDRWKSSTGKVSSSMLEGAINVLINQLIASGAYASAQVVDGKGCLFENTKIDSPDYGALYIGPGIFAIADEKVDGNWNWRTFGKGSGFTADQLIAGKILTSLVRIEGSTHFYWDGDTLYCIDPEDANRQIRINKDGIKYTVDGGATINNALDYDGLHVGTHGTSYGIQDCNALFHYDTHLKSTRGLAPEGKPVATLRPGEGRFGGAVAVEEGTTNLLSGHLIATEAEKNNYKGWSVLGTGNDTRKSIDSSNIPVSPNTTYTFSCVYWSSDGFLDDIYLQFDGTGYPEGNIYLRVTEVNGWNGSTTKVIDLGNGFYKRMGTFTTTADTANIVDIFFDSDEVDREVFIADVQLEQKSFATSFVDGTRAAGSLKYPKSLLNPTEGTIYFWQKINKFKADTYNAILTTGHLASDLGGRLNIMADGNQKCLIVFDSDGTNEEMYYSAVGSLTEGEWFSGALTWGPAGRALYLNGELVATNPKTDPIGFSYPDGNIQVGTWNDGNFFNGLQDEDRYDTIQRTAEEIKAWHESGVPFVDEGQTQIADTTEITNEGVKASHNDGSYTMLSADGLQRHTTTGEKDYFYLYTTARVSVVGNHQRTASPWIASEAEVLTYIPPVTVTLPSDYRNKSFKVFVEARLNQTAINVIWERYIEPGDYGYRYFQKREFVVEAYDIDYVNATFKIKAYSWVRFGDTVSTTDYENIDGLDVVYTVTA